MLSDDSPEKASLLAHFAPMAELTARNGAPPETVDTLTGQTRNSGPPGFSGALLPFLAGSPAAKTQRERLQKHPPDKHAYYNQALTLFGQGWDQHRFQFDKEGRLVPTWVACTN
jgi:endoglucanase